MYTVKFCTKSEINKLQDYLYNHWSKKHVFALNSDLLLFQHYNNSSDSINFVIALNNVSNEVDGILGFIPFSHFDNKLNNKDIWMAIWGVCIDDISRHVNGLDLLFFLTEKLQPNSIGVLGTSQKASQIYKALGYKTGKMNHYFIAAEKPASEFKLLQNYEHKKPKENSTRYNNDFIINKINNLDELEVIKKLYKPNKSIEFLKNKYVLNPYYKYNLFGIYLDNILKCVFVIKKIIVNSYACLRIVDMYGRIDEVSDITQCIKELLHIENAEYIDCINYGISDNVFKRLGFENKIEPIVIPNYFEPFESRNVTLEFAYKSTYDEYVIFKGDGDQERPNKL